MGRRNTWMNSQVPGKSAYRSLAKNQSRSVRKMSPAPILLINMTGGTIFHGSTPVEDRQVPDPFGRDLAVYRRTCDELKRRVPELAKRLRASAAARPASER